MGRACLQAIFLACAGLASAGGVAAAAEARPPLPAGAASRSVPYRADLYAEATPAKPVGATAEKRRAAARPQSKEKPRLAAKAAKQKAAHAASAKRHPVAAAAVPEQPPRATAAGRAKELERRLDILMPGTKLGAAIEDRENPSWRRARRGDPAGEHNALAVPLDDAGKAGLLARGYHAQPDVQNPHGNTGATFGLRTRF